MKRAWNWIKNNPNRAMFLLPILLVAAISISHVVSWYDMANPTNWAIYLSIAIEFGAITALVAATNKIKGGIWFMFGIVTFIQVIGNVFYCYKEIDESGELFKSWVELTGPVWEMMGTEVTDVVGMKRWLAFLEGGLLPIISLTSLHFFVKYEKPKEEVKTKEAVKQKENNPMTEHPPSKNLDAQAELEKQLSGEVARMVKKLDEEVRMSKIESENRQQRSLVEEENPEDELITPEEVTPEEVTPEEVTTEGLKNKLQNKGEELSKAWKKIISRSKNNKLGE